jgi:hypothetical protein
VRHTAALNTTTDREKQSGAGVPARGASRPRRRRTMGLCAHCHRPVEVEQEHLRLHRLFWHMDCALAAHEPATK